MELTVLLWERGWGNVGIAMRGSADRHLALDQRPPP